MLPYSVLQDYIINSAYFENRNFDIFSIVLLFSIALSHLWLFKRQLSVASRG